jgi:hypothetical protein
MSIIPNQTSIDQGNFRQEDLSKFRENISTVPQGSSAIPIVDYSMSEKIEILKSERSKTLIKTFQLVSFKRIPLLIKRKRPLKSIRANLRLFDASLEYLVSKADATQKSIHSNMILNLAFIKQSNITEIDPLTAEEQQYPDWINNEVGTSGTVFEGDINQYDPFVNLDRSSTYWSTAKSTGSDPLWPTADSIFRMAVKIYTSKEDQTFFEISTNTPFNYLEYPFNKPFTDENYTIYYRIGRNIILSYYQNKDSVYIING